jgi:hypothetical protein
LSTLKAPDGNPIEGLPKPSSLRSVKTPTAFAQSMNPAEGIFLYTPIPYFAAFVLLLYRNDLSRLRHLFRDDGTQRTWWVVLNHLGLVTTEQAARIPSRKRESLPYAVFLSASLVLSLSWLLRAFPLLWYCLVIVQGVAGLILSAAAVRYFGPAPRRPYVDVLTYPRLGSRLRHLARLPKEKRKTRPAAIQESQQGDGSVVTQSTQERAN